MPFLMNSFGTYISPTPDDRVGVTTSAGTIIASDIWLDENTSDVQGVGPDGAIFSYSRKNIVSITHITTYNPAEITEIIYDDGSTETSVATSGQIDIHVDNFHQDEIHSIPSGVIFVPPVYIRHKQTTMPSGRKKLWFRLRV